MKYLFPTTLLLLFCWIFGPNTALSQNRKSYIDHRPEYRKWQDSYKIDQIKYTRTRTIFYLRFACRNTPYANMIFYPAGDEQAWYLRAPTTQKVFELQDVHNIRCNGKLINKHLQDAPYAAATSKESGYSIFTCELHFERLPHDLKKVDLIEGRNQANNKKYLNCFDIQLKAPKTDNLGRRRDSNQDKKEFQERFPLRL